MLRLIAFRILQGDLASEKPVKEDEVTYCQCDPNQPPNQSYSHAVITRFGVENRQTIGRVGGGGQQVRVHRKGRTSEHAENVTSRREKYGAVFSFSAKVKHGDERCDDHQRDDPTPDTQFEIVDHLWTNI